MRRAIILALLASLASINAQAEEKSGFTIAPMVGYTMFEDGIDDDTHFGINLGYKFANPWAIELSYADASADLENAVGDVDFTRWTVDGLYHFDDGRPRPYLSFGIGQGDYEMPGASDDGLLVNLGLGVKWAIAENTAIRSELKALTSNDDIDAANFAIGVGIHHIFARAAAPVQAIAPAPVDSDNDGVLDENDRCPDTPAGARVNGRGCPLDTDRDGVFDYADQCPGTTNRRARIDEVGCYVVLAEDVRVELNVEFDNDSSAARPEHRAEVRRVFEFMEEYPLTRVRIEGHTDSRGSAEYNRDLSQRRADTIASILVNDFGIDASRVSAVGIGEAQPIADNETAEGRQRNRRVIGVVEATVERIERR